MCFASGGVGGSLMQLDPLHLLQTIMCRRWCWWQRQWQRSVGGCLLVQRQSATAAWCSADSAHVVWCGGTVGRVLMTGVQHGMEQRPAQTSLSMVASLQNWHSFVHSCGACGSSAPSACWLSMWCGSTRNRVGLFVVVVHWTCPHCAALPEGRGQSKAGSEIWCFGTNSMDTFSKIIPKRLGSTPC